MTTKRPVILDVDTGIDDALAILYALLSPRLQVLGITTCFGNGDVENTTRNTLAMVEMSRVSVPVFRGAADPLVGKWAPQAEAFHGGNGLGNAPIEEPHTSPEHLSATEYLRAAILEHPGEITLITLARLTNLAIALKNDPSLAQKIRRVVVMGGAAFVGGNVTPVAEANIWGDPDAAWVVFHSGVPITMVGLDVTMQVNISDAQVQKMDPDRPYAPVMKQALDFYLSAYNPGAISGARQAPLHDPLAVAVAEDPTLCTTSDLSIDIEREGTITRGMTVVDQRGWLDLTPNAAVCRSVDAPRFLRDFCQRLGFPIGSD
ncbi:MAG: nucleoside hydrolase [Sulfobacillus benefaciens]|uniref:Nucleoside hydrolase n=1 Tax=Sulfobacillus benefaciens TaxID=453960 RepID=A0A2T2XJB4_9FIRM|nr:MAG: nucleoside hydrolase [Sulfobacillus benefaciens]